MEQMLEKMPWTTSAGKELRFRASSSSRAQNTCGAGQECSAQLGLGLGWGRGSLQVRAVFVGSSVDLWDRHGLETEERGNGVRLIPSTGFQVVKLGSEDRHWNNEKSGSGSRSELDSGSERRLELDPTI